MLHWLILLVVASKLWQKINGTGCLCDLPGKVIELPWGWSSVGQGPFSESISSLLLCLVMWVQLFLVSNVEMGLPWWLSGKEPACQSRRSGFGPWVGKIPWRREWQPTPVLLPEKSHGQRSLVGYSPWGCKESDITEPLNNNRNSSLIMRDSSSQSTCSKSRGNCRKSEGMIELRKKKPIILQLLLKVDLSKDHQCMKPLNERLMGEF